MRLIDADVLIDKLPKEYLGSIIHAMINEAPTIGATDIKSAYNEGVMQGIAEAIKLTERMRGGWIPCSEKLPSEKGMYLVTSREKATAEEFGFDLDDVEVKKMRFDEDGWRIPKHIPEWINGVVHTTVLAWMPLPEPYGEREGE